MVKSRLCLAIMLIGMASAIEIGQAQAHTLNCYSHPGRCQAALEWNKHQRHVMDRALAHQFSYNVHYGLALSQVLFHVDLSRLVGCESGNDPSATNGWYWGATQQGPNFRSRPFARTMYDFFSPFDPVANILVAAHWIALHGASEWQCSV